MEELKYPIGKFQYQGPYSEEQKRRFIKEIAETPAILKEAIKNFSEAQLETPYRQGGWTVRQVVNHMADSHMNAFIRFKLALTEENPTIKPYEQDQWANLADSLNSPIELSLNLLDTLHQKWVILLNSLSSDDFKRTYMHPESGSSNLEKVLGMYAWHSKHHLAHVTGVRDRLRK
ncbi:MAG TPA: putative metal-dependent hydrolase [Cytophagales bacterium]|nr:putative metal-dependent hydrolase [Cytophagales bacterium]